MSETSTFSSRNVKLRCSAEEFFSFITDLRNFGRFISSDTFNNIIINRDSCSFNAGMLGDVNIRISEKTMFSRVIFNGDTVQIRDFRIHVNIIETPDRKAEVNVSLIAEMNPILKMMAADPVERFLERLVDEMEKMEDWSASKSQNQSP